MKSKEELAVINKIEKILESIDYEEFFIEIKTKKRKIYYRAKART